MGINKIEYSKTLHQVIDILRDYPPVYWTEIGLAVYGEGEYQKQAHKEEYEIEYD